MANPGARYTGGLVTSGNVGVQYDINVAGTTILSATASRVTVNSGGLTVTAGGATITGTTTIDTSCTSLTLSGLPTAACCLTSGQVWVALSGCCCCAGDLRIIP